VHLQEPLQDKKNPYDWDSQYESHGHTGYADNRLYRYDQPLRMRFVRSSIRRVVGKLSTPKFSLDIGSGSGDVMAELHATNLNVQGVDISHSAVESANRRFQNDPDVTAELIDLQSWRPKEEHFDLITSITVLQHIDDLALPTVLENLRKALTQHGRMLVLEIAPNSATTPAAKLNGVIERSSTRWETIFVDAKFEIMSDHKYAPIGPLAIHKFERVVDSITGVGHTPESTAESEETTSTKTSLKQRLLRTLFQTSRAAILAAFWPFDYVFKLSMPDSKAYYRLYELKPASENRDQPEEST
jgi:2-polyprenyl-3-methyl-5-hydroxy-6-metoxy-1,4-benzoquinol methylase